MNAIKALGIGLGLILVLATGGAVQAQAPPGYEKEPVLKAKDLAGPELLQGPHFTVDPEVPVKGFIARFTIRSPFGTFQADGLRMLPIRVNEVEALAKLEELSRTREFIAAAGRQAVRPVTAAANMVSRPVETVTGIPGGVTRLFGRIGLATTRVVQAARTPGGSGVERTVETSRRLGGVVAISFGFEQERRKLAERLGVDPYTTNPVLSERLTDVAWVSFSGRSVITAATSILVPYSMAMASVSVTDRGIFDTPAGDLVNRASAIFAETGASRTQVQSLMANPYYSLSVLTAVATGIQRLQGVAGRESVVIFAAAAETEDEANFVAGAVNMLARYHETVAPLAWVSAPGPILGRTEAGALVLPAPIDLVSWIAPVRETMGRAELQAPEKRGYLSGWVTPLASKRLTSLGWNIYESFPFAWER